MHNATLVRPDHMSSGPLAVGSKQSNIFNSKSGRGRLGEVVAYETSKLMERMQQIPRYSNHNGSEINDLILPHSSGFHFTLFLAITKFPESLTVFFVLFYFISFIYFSRFPFSNWFQAQGKEKIRRNVLRGCSRIYCTDRKRSRQE